MFYVGDVKDELLDDMLEEVDLLEVLSVGFVMVDVDSIVKVKFFLREYLKVFCLFFFLRRVVRLYFENCYGVVDGKVLLDVVWCFGLNEFVDGFGSFDVLVYVDLVVYLLGDLIFIFEWMIFGV